MLSLRLRQLGLGAVSSQENLKMTINKEKYVCWCSKVTESDIITSIERGASSAKEVISLTGAMRNCDCKNKNPRGT